MNGLAVDPLTPRPASIARVVRETRDTFTLALDVSGWPGGFRFAPGQFNMLYRFGAGEVPISISGRAERRPELLLHTIRAVGPVTGSMEDLRRGDSLGVRGPFGSAWPLDEARGRDVLFVAGGLGLAPLRQAVREVLERRDDFGRVAVLYGARSPEDLLYPKELERWRARLGATVETTVDRASPGWRGSQGVVTGLVARAEIDPARAVALVCGPEVMMRFAARELEKRGVPEASIWLSLERNMKCAVGHCGHCQLGPAFVCKDGPVFRLDRVAPLLATREV